MARDTNAGARKTASAITWIAFVLLVIGGLNWGLVGLFDFDLVAALFGQDSAIARTIYTLVGLSALYCAFAIPRLLRHRYDAALEGPRGEIHRPT